MKIDTIETHQTATNVFAVRRHQAGVKLSTSGIILFFAMEGTAMAASSMAVLIGADSVPVNAPM